jgi:hypothetical protein
MSWLSMLRALRGSDMLRGAHYVAKTRAFVWGRSFVQSREAYL